MQTLLRRMREERANGDRGFTMIELLVVVVIIGVLVAIAIPLYLNYRKGAENKSAQSDVRSAISAVEQYYTDNNNTYPPGAAAGVTISSVGPSTIDLGGTPPQTISVSPNNKVAYKTFTTYYVLCAQNSDGLLYYGYNSSKGGSVAKVTPAPTDLTACLGAV